MDLVKLAKENPDINITLTGKDLSELVAKCNNDLETYVSETEAIKILNINRSTLFRWKKKGYISITDIRGRMKYRMSDIKNILEGKA
jgi:xanthine dehydrogenase iron-sulfur cluster and FAD-binding subunit A